MKRRWCLGLLGVAPWVKAEPRATLTDFVPFFNKEVLAEVNRSYRAFKQDSRAVFVGRPQLLGTQHLRVRFIERWPSLGQLAMLIVERDLYFDQAADRWWLVNTGFQVWSIPDQKLGPTPRQYLDPTQPPAHPTIQVATVDHGEGAFAEAVKELLRRWQRG